MHALRDVFSGKEDLRSSVVGGVPLLGEWLLSFDVVVMCPVIRSPMDDATTTHRVVIIPVATCLFLRFDWRRGPRPRRHESWRDLASFEGIVA
jgi:hypothetical protein